MRSKLFDDFNNSYADTNMSMEAMSLEINQFFKDCDNICSELHNVSTALEETNTFVDILSINKTNPYAKKSATIALESAFRRNHIPLHISLETEEEKKGFFRRIYDWIIEKLKAIRDWIAEVYSTAKLKIMALFMKKKLDKLEKDIDTLAKQHAAASAKSNHSNNNTKQEKDNIDKAMDKAVDIILDNTKTMSAIEFMTKKIEALPDNDPLINNPMYKVLIGKGEAESDFYPIENYIKDGEIIYHNEYFEKLETINGDLMNCIKSKADPTSVLENHNVKQRYEGLKPIRKYPYIYGKTSRANIIKDKTIKLNKGDIQFSYEVTQTVDGKATVVMDMYKEKSNNLEKLIADNRPSPVFGKVNKEVLIYFLKKYGTSEKLVNLPMVKSVTDDDVKNMYLSATNSVEAEMKLIKNHETNITLSGVNDQTDEEIAINKDRIEILKLMLEICQDRLTFIGQTMQLTKNNYQAFGMLIDEVTTSLNKVIQA